MGESSVIAVVRLEDPCTVDARILLDELSAMLALRCADSAQHRFRVEDVKRARSAFVVARTMDGGPIGCGALRRFSYEVAEFKRIYRRPEWPGVGSAILSFLENVAARMNYRRAVVQTRAQNSQAIAFYLRHGYAPIEPYGEYMGMPEARCFAKDLVQEG